MLVLCLCRVRQRDFTQLHALCVSMCIHVYAYMYAICTRYVRDMHAAARALHSSTLKAARRHLGMSVCRRRRSAGLQRVRVCCGSRSSRAVSLGRPVSAVLRSCGPAALRPCGCGLCCHAVSDACARPGTASHHLLAAATREVALVALVFLSVHLSLVALEAWRWMLGDGGLALEAWRWRPRGPSPCVAVLLARCLRCLSLLARRGSAWHAAW